MKSVTVTEIMDWRTCRLKWHYRHQLGLEPNQRPPLMASGSALHAAVASKILGIPLDIEDFLMQQFGDEENKEELVQKYAPGVHRALGRVPAWVWEEQSWHSEELVSGIYDNGELEIRGRPDLWRLRDGVLEVVEVKTTDASALDYLLWVPQARWYAALLDDQHFPDAHLIKFLYLCVGTGTKEALRVQPWVLTQPALEKAREQMVGWAKEVGILPILPNNDRHCAWCEFAPLARVRGGLTMGDEGYIMKQWFQSRRR